MAHEHDATTRGRGRRSTNLHDSHPTTPSTNISEPEVERIESDVGARDDLVLLGGVGVGVGEVLHEEVATGTEFERFLARDTGILAFLPAAAGVVFGRFGGGAFLLEGGLFGFGFLADFVSSYPRGFGDETSVIEGG